jgi:AraC-like DNA-binding protein
VEINFFNPRSVIIFVCLLQGAIFAALLFWRGWCKKIPSDFWLAVLLIVFCSSLITPFIGFANVYDLNQWLTYFPFSLAYSYGIGVYFYVLSLTNSEHKFRRKDLLLFIPAAVYLVFRLALFAQSLEFKNWFDENYYVPLVNPILFVTEFIWNVIFLILSLKHYRKYRAWLNENFSDTEKIKFDWLGNFLYVFTFVFVLGGLFDFTDSFIFNLSYIQYFYFQLILALTTYYLAIAGYLRSETPRLNFESNVKANTNETSEVSPLKTAIAEVELEKHKTNLQSLMKSEKPYLEPQLTLADLSKQIGINTTVLSYVINQGFRKNFNDFVNGYRVEEIKEKLQNGTAKNLNLLGVALECGFNSKATFNRAFKKITGVSPKEFQTGAETSLESNRNVSIPTKSGS